jgi:hypothetical protein
VVTETEGHGESVSQGIRRSGEGGRDKIKERRA